MIVSNQAHCRQCGTEIYSANRHDYKTCECGSISVDGGQDYLRRSGAPEHLKEKSIILKARDVAYIVNEVQKSRESGRNDIGVAYAALRAIRDTGLLKGFISERSNP